VQLTDPKATQMEGNMLGHSVGGYADYGTYNHGGREAFENGVAQIYSLRDAKGRG
jgi:hypothetical protein